MTFYQVKKYSTVSNIQWMTAQVQSTVKITCLSNPRLSKLMENGYYQSTYLFKIKKYILKKF